MKMKKFFICFSFAIFAVSAAHAEDTYQGRPVTPALRRQIARNQALLAESIQRSNDVSSRAVYAVYKQMAEANLALIAQSAGKSVRQYVVQKGTCRFPAGGYSLCPIVTAKMADNSFCMYSSENPEYGVRCW